MQNTILFDQLMTLVVTVVLGTIIGIGFDVLSVFRQFVRLSRTLQFVIDFFYCLCMTVLVFLALVANNWGEVRAYVFFGLGTGLLLYIFLFHRFSRNFMVKTAQTIISAIWVIARPFLWVYHKAALFMKFNRRLYLRQLATGKKTVKKIQAKFHRKKKE